MSQAFPQFVPAKPPLTPLSASGKSALEFRFNQTGHRTHPILRLEVRRSLQMHRRLAIGLALIGLALALIYLLNAWSICTVQNLNGFYPARSSNVANSSLKQMTAMGPGSGSRRTELVSRFAGRGPHVGRHFPGSIDIGNDPGLPGLAGASIVPWYSADSGVLRNALVLLLSFIFLGGLIAIVAHKADPRVYIASEVEQLLGFPPMAQLPDFSEVANEITEEHLLRLASGIDLGFRDRGFRRCVLTGAGSEVGVTTVATRLKKLLETMGRASVVADAAEGLNLAESKQSEMVLVDAAPLADSEETERLVQSAHCTIVVIESGVTTRTQLRTVANILQRIKAPAVGFVLNRVRLATADPEFRRSIREKGKQLCKQGQFTDWQMLQTLEQAIEKGRASLDLDVATSPSQAAARPLEKISPTASLFDGSFPPDRSVPPKQADVSEPASVQGIRLVPHSRPAPANQLGEEILSPVADIASQFDQVPAEQNAEVNQTPIAAHSGTNGNATGHEPANPSRQKAAHVSLPRLSDLRSMRFSQALRELDLARHPASPSSSIELLMSAIAPFEPMFTHTELPPSKNDDLPEAAPTEPDLPASLRAFIPTPESGLSPEANGGVSAECTGTTVNHLHSDSFPAKPRSNTKSKGRPEEEGELSEFEPNDTRQKLAGPFEQVQILPSRRGQYKKKS